MTTSLAHFPILVFSMCVVFGAGDALAQAPRSASVEQLQVELERRDAIIADLLQRVQALEQRLGTQPQARPAAPPSPRPSTPRARSAAEEAAEEALLERALERSLVLSGGALLPRGTREIEPSFAYDYSQRAGVALVGDGAVFRNFRRENFTGALALRAGLPGAAQLDVALPFVRQRVETVVGTLGASASDRGVGDIQVALTRQFLNERDSRVSLLAGIGWVHGSDAAPLRSLALGLPDFLAPAAVGSGHDAFIARLTATKRLDPMVFVGSLSHVWSRPENVAGIDARTGDVNGASVRAILAASPDVSVRTGLSFARTGKLRLNGSPVAGSASTASVLELGTSVVLNRSMLLDVSLGVGLTGESPDFAFGVSFPMRF